MRLKGQTRPNRYTFPFLISSCSRLSGVNSGWQVHCHVLKHGCDMDLHVKNSLVGFYACFGELVVARKVFDGISKQDVVSFNVMMSGYCKGGELDNGFRVFKGMVELGLRPDERTFGCLTLICSKSNDLKNGKLVHMLALKHGCVNSLKLALVDMYVKLGDMDMANRVFNIVGGRNNIKVSSCMVLGYAKCGDIENACRIFNDMPKKDLISWTTMISGYARNGKYKEAVDLYKQMDSKGIKPDEVTLAAALSACAHLGYLNLGKRLHLFIDENFFNRKNSRLYTTIIDMYAKCGYIGKALELFDGFDKRFKTTSMFNSIISGLAQHGLGERAISVFKDMDALNLRPDEITFVGVLCACSHSGLIKDGGEIFDMMINKYDIQPQIEHHGCMVDLLGRQGYLNEAYEYINKMPIRSNFIIWANLLRNSRVHKNAGISKITERNLLQIDSNDANSSKLRKLSLSEMFAINQENAKKVRNMINYKPVYKQLGLSYVELNGNLHQFGAKDIYRSHSQSKEIYLMLDEMLRKLSLEKTTSVVCQHSETLALAFGLINLNPGEIIRIIMDLRICDDSHSSFKIYSKVFNRKIVVRDKVRFHLMTNGVCSCLDFW